MAFIQATKEQSKLRLALFGPSGAGKTYTALRIATGMGGPIAVADTERRTARKYSDRFKFAVEELSDKSIDAYCKVIKEAGEGNFNVLIIDSLSHAWQELLQDVDKLASAKYRGNTWSAWSEGTPKQRRLVDTLLDCPCHIIATMRSKTDWAQETGNNGKIKPVKIGLAPEQGKGIEYEFDMLMEMSVDHFATISKDRTGKYQDKIIEKPDEQFGRDLIGWLSEGAAPAAPDRASRTRARRTRSVTTRNLTLARSRSSGVSSPPPASPSPAAPGFPDATRLRKGQDYPWRRSASAEKNYWRSWHRRR
jgi:hypothetical protein